MIKKLKSKRDFVRVYRTGKTYRGSYMYMKAAKNLLGESRVQIVVPKKISKKAVVRNKNRRRVYEAFLTFSTSVKTGLDVIVFITRDTNELSFDDIRKEVVGLARLTGVLNG